METPESIERRLSRSLTPRGFSGEGMLAIEEMLDELAGESGSRSLFNGHGWRWMSGSAAAGVLLAVGLTWMFEAPAVQEMRPITTRIQPVSLISEEEGVVAASLDEQFLSDDDGNLMRAWRVAVVNREQFLDPQTGHKVTIVRPRDEVVLMPVSSF